MLHHSGHLIFLARRAYERSISDPSDALSSIMMSAISLECFINEFSGRLQQERFKENPELIRVAFILKTLEESKATLLAKVEAITFLLTGAEAKKGELPYQDVAFLMQLRNALIHRKPEKVEWDFDKPNKKYEPHKYVQYLINRKVIEAPMPTNPPVWSQYIVSPNVARWAHNTVVEMIHHVTSLIPESLFAETTKLITVNMIPIE